MDTVLTLACSVCYGEPGNPLTEGAKWGVIVLALVIVGVLSGFIGLIAFWSVRAKRLEAQGLYGHAPARAGSPAPSGGA